MLNKIHLIEKCTLYVSPIKWTEEADRDLIKQCNKKKSPKFDERARRRLRVLKSNERRLHDYLDIDYNLDDLMKYVHQKVVSTALYSKALKKLKDSNKENEQLRVLKNQLAKLAA
jgi:flagellar motility protein MotE (MotC chaperone)